MWHWYCPCCPSLLTAAPSGLEGCKSRLSLFRGRMSYMAAKPGFSFLWSPYGIRQTIIFTRRRSSSFAEYCKHFVARLNDVHAFGYNSAGSEWIWMKFGELWVYGLELSLTNFGRDPRRSGSVSRFLFFCPLNNAWFHWLPVGQISRNLHKKTCFRVLCWGFGKHLWKFALRVFFPKKTSILAWSKSTISDFQPRFLRNDYKSWKVMTGWHACGMLAFHWHHWNELKVIPLACNPRTRRAICFPKILFYGVHRRRLHGMLHNAERCK